MNNFQLFAFNFKCVLYVTKVCFAILQFTNYISELKSKRDRT